MSCGLPDLTEGSPFMQHAIEAHNAGRRSEREQSGGLLGLMTSILGEDKVQEIKRRVWTDKASDTSRRGEFVVVNSLPINKGAFDAGVIDTFMVVHFRHAGNATLIGRDPSDGQYLADFTDWEGDEDLVWLREEDFVTQPQEITLR